MLRSIHVRGFGPHVDTTVLLDPNGRTDIVGPSAAGKTSLVDAVSWCLWGHLASGRQLPERLINDECDEVTVTLTTSKGTRFTRTRKRGVKGGQLLVNDVRVATHAEWLGKLGPLGDHPELLRIVIAPLQWCSMAEAGADGKALLTRDASGAGRPLRDLLATLLSTLNPAEERKVVGELMGQAEPPAELREGDSIVLDEAMVRRTEANRAHTELVGRHGAAVEHHARLLEQQRQGVEQPSPQQAQEARATLSLLAAWDAWRPGAAWDERRKALGERPADTSATIDQARATIALAAAWDRWRPVAAWDAKRAALGERPDTAAHDRELAERHAVVDAAQAKLDDLRARLAEAEHPEPVPAELVAARDAAIARVDALTAQSSGETVCPHCHQEIVDALERAIEAKRALPEAATAADAARKGLFTAENEARRAVAARVAPLQAERTLAAAALEQAKSALLAAAKSDPAARWDAQLSALGERPRGGEKPSEPEPTAEALASARKLERELSDAGARWDAALSALGPRPPGSAPAAPAPTAEQVTEARRIERELIEAAGRRKQLEAEVRRAAADTERLVAERLAAEAEGKRLDALVEAIRRAPSILAQRQVAALGDLGPVKISMPATGPAIEILIDGRPWWTASRGRMVVGDLWLRRALRRALKRQWLALFVDNCQDWSGELPTEGPCVVLRTQAGTALTSSAAAPAPAVAA